MNNRIKKEHKIIKNASRSQNCFKTDIIDKMVRKVISKKIFNKFTTF